MNPKNGLNIRLEGRRLALARGIWVGFALMSLLIFALGTAAQDHRWRIPCAEVPLEDQARCWPTEKALSQLGFTWDDLALISTTTSLIAIVPSIFIGSFIYWWKSDDLFHFLFSLGMIAQFSVIVNYSLVTDLVVAYPGLNLPAAFVHWIAQIFVGLIFFIFPDGRFVLRWTRWLAFLWIIRSLYLEAVPFIPSLLDNPINDPLDLFLFPFLAVNIYAMVYRYRYDANPEQRQQMKWVLFVIVLALPVVGGLYALLRLQRPGFFNLFVYGVYVPIYYLFTLLAAISLAISILRYRLWDLDLIINRTLIYGMLTATLGLVYFSSVVVLQRIFPAQSQIAVVASTLTVAALFTPLRRSVQTRIDRRFYRRKYDAQQTLASFSVKMREEVDIESLSETLLHTVSGTLQPDRIALWLQQPQKNPTDITGPS